MTLAVLTPIYSFCLNLGTKCNFRDCENTEPVKIIMSDEESTTYTAHSSFEYEYNCHKTWFGVTMKGFQSDTSIPNDMNQTVRIFSTYYDCKLIHRRFKKT